MGFEPELVHIPWHNHPHPRLIFFTVQNQVTCRGQNGIARRGRSSTMSCLAKRDLLNFFGGPARIRTGDRQVSLAGGMSLPLFQSVDVKPG